LCKSRKYYSPSAPISFKNKSNPDSPFIQAGNSDVGSENKPENLFSIISNESMNQVIDDDQFRMERQATKQLEQGIFLEKSAIENGFQGFPVRFATDRIPNAE